MASAGGEAAQAGGTGRRVRVTQPEAVTAGGPCQGLAEMRMQRNKDVFNSRAPGSLVAHGEGQGEAFGHRHWLHSSLLGGVERQP